MFAIILLAIAVGGAEPKSKRVELEAETWINPPPIVFPDDRSYTVLFFSTSSDKEKREETEKLIEKLQKLAKRKDNLVLLLSPDKESAVRRFVKKEKIELPVGAGTKSNKQFEVEDFPKVIFLERTANGTLAPWNNIPANYLDFITAAERSGGLVSGTFDEGSTTEKLTRHAREDPDDDERERALKILRGRMPVEQYLNLCDKLLAEHDPSEFDYGKIAYQRHLADPSVTEEQPRNAACTLAIQARRQTPSDPRWARVNEYEKAANEKSVDQLWTDYQTSLTDDPSDLLIRLSIADGLDTSSDRIGARSTLMRMLPIETDHAIRIHIIGSMMDVCPTGDTEAADFLEAQLAHETNIRNVRPFLLTTIRRLRTGE